MTTYAILLRGVMPTGRNRVPMAELRTALTAAGLREVRTYIQSGNVVARSDLAAAAVASLVQRAIVADIGADIAVIVRTHDELRGVLAANPFPPDAATRTYFTLLQAPPAAPLAAAMSAFDFAPEAVQLAGRTIYTCYATRYSDSKFNNNFFERRLKVAATTRNFNTLSRLVELSGP